MKKINSFVIIFMLIISIFQFHNFVSLAAFDKGEGTAKQPYIIRTIDDLYKIPEDPTAHYKIANDLDFKNAKRQPMAEFSGVLDGDGHTISNLIIVSEQNYNVGLFAETENATFKNLNITNCSIDFTRSHIGIISGYSRYTKFENINIDKLSVSGEQYIGGICGFTENSNYTNCIVSNSQLIDSNYVIGGITGSSHSCIYQNCYSVDNVLSGYDGLGGLVGNSNESSYIKCYSTSDIEGTGNSGGLLGYVSNGTYLKECFTSGNIRASSNIGGLIGELNSSEIIIENSYSLCYLVGIGAYTEISGLIGLFYPSTIDELIPTIRNSYFAGKVDGRHKNGLVSPEPKINIHDSYFNASKTEISSPTTQARTTKEMYQKFNYNNWDFDTIWVIEEGKGYPKLRFVKDGTGSSEEPAQDEIASMVVIEKTEKLQLSVSDSLLNNEELEWSSSDEMVAAVNKNGLVTACKTGETLITAKSQDGEYKESIYVMVVGDASSYRLTVELKVDGSCKVRIRGIDNNTLKWNSMDNSVASVTEQGKVKAITNGLSVLTAVDEEGLEVGQVYIRVR